MKLRLLTLLVTLIAPCANAVSLDAVIYTMHGELPLSLEIAATPSQRARGLMHREEMGDHDGMIFLFPTADNYTFWMKDTPLPLDMLFINSDCEIVFIAPQTVPNSLAPIAAGQPVNKVIELDAGRAAREGIAVGDHIRHVVPKSVEIR